MTVHINLASCRPFGVPTSPGIDAGPSKPQYQPYVKPFGQTSSCPPSDLWEVVSSFRASRRIVVVSGAGVSTAAAIPDFRSASGLFSGGATTSAVTAVDKGKGKPEQPAQPASETKGRAGEKGPGAKDLFHVRCLSSPTLLARHQALISSLATLSLLADPTAFHRLLKTLDESGQLLRCYTQNIDGLEGKAGLSLGLPSTKTSKKGKGRAAIDPSVTNGTANSKAGEAAQLDPRAIPLHGLLTQLHCSLCHTSAPLQPYLPLPAHPLPCPTCELSTSIRSALSERARRSGTLRPSVVLYGEEHPQGEVIGGLVERDLSKKAGADFLLVIGTSLSVPGVKRLIKEMAKSVRSRQGSTPKRKGGASKAAGGTTAIRTVFVNDEPPSRAAEWEGLFDIWVQGDVQSFVRDYLDNPAFYSNPPASDVLNENDDKGAVDVPLTPKKRKVQRDVLPPTPESLEKSNAKRPRQSTDGGTPTKPTRARTTPSKRRGGGGGAEAEAAFPPTPESMPRPPIRAKERARERSRSVSPTPLPLSGAGRDRSRLEGSLTPLSDMD